MRRVPSASMLFDSSISPASPHSLAMAKRALCNEATPAATNWKRLRAVADAGAVVDLDEEAASPRNTPQNIPADYYGPDLISDLDQKPSEHYSQKASRIFLHKDSSRYRSIHRRPCRASVYGDICILGPWRTEKCRARQDGLEFWEAWALEGEMGLLRMQREKMAEVGCSGGGVGLGCSAAGEIGPGNQAGCGSGSAEGGIPCGWALETILRSEHARRFARAVLYCNETYTIFGPWRDGKTKAERNLDLLIAAFHRGGRAGAELTARKLSAAASPIPERAP